MSSEVRKAVILGGGVSGKAALRLCRALGIDAAILNDGEADALPPCDLVIASPGVHPLRSGLYRAAQGSGVPMTSEMCFGFRRLGIPCAAVTGTNGKTTTTELTGALLASQGLTPVCCGNIGRPVADVAAEMIEAGKKLYDAAVIEVSSFQLELAEGFSPDAAALLNLASDHEDRYKGGFAEYAAVKRRIFDRVRPENRVYGITMPDDCTRRVEVKNESLLIDGVPLLKLNETRLGAPHNAENLAAALELVLRLVPNPDAPKLAAAAREFKPGAHRIEAVGKVDGVAYINDSKGTNPAAVIAAVRSLTGKIVIMLGGLGKGMDFTPLAELAPRLRAAVVYGEARETIGGIMRGAGVPTVDAASDFERAFELARGYARPGDTVLMSPACASMDMFKNYEERGNVFRELVKHLSEVKK